jgi:TRAP transporter TAXI family solute receptor
MKKFHVLASVLLASCLALGACSGSSGTAAGGGLTRLELATGGTSGTYFPFGGIIATVLSNNVDNLEITATSTGASIANARQIQSGESDMALMQNDVMYYAFNGTEMLEDEGGMPNLRTIANLYPEFIQLVATQQSGITSVADLAGRRVSVGDAGSGTEANARQILLAFGLGFNDVSVQNLSFGESSAAMQQGTIDAAFVTAGVPNAAITELNQTTNVIIVPISGAQADILIAEYPFYSKQIINDTDYTGIPGAPTVAVMAALAVTSELDEDLVYNMTRALFENQPEIALGHAKGNELSLDSAVTGVAVPFHPGAERYYREQGVID